MHIIHQKNILHLSPAEERCTGTSIFQISLEKDETLEIVQTQLKIIKVEINEAEPAGEKAEHGSISWKKVQADERNRIEARQSTAQVRVLFEISQANQSISFYRSPGIEHMEAIGEPISSLSNSLFPTLSAIGTSDATNGHTKNTGTSAEGHINRYNLDMIYIVPSEKNIQVFSSGALVGIYDGGTTKSFHYKIEGIDSRVTDKVLFAAGTFSELQSGRISVLIPSYLSSKYLAGHKEALDILKNILSSAQALLDCKLPYGRLYSVFAMSPVSEIVIGRNCAIINISQLPCPEEIDQCFQTVKTFGRIVAAQYYTVYAYAYSDLDHWIYTGLMEHTACILSETLLGSNEYKYELYRGIEYIHRYDIDEPPLSSASREKYSLKSVFYITKSGIFMKVLENNLTPAFMHKIMREVIERRNITTNDLMRIVKGITGKDVRTLFDAYVLRSGIPTVSVSVEHGRAGGVSVMLRQKINSVHPEANKFICGNICIRVYESDSVLDHVLFLGSVPISHELSGINRSSRKRQKEDASSLLWVRVDPGLEWMKVSTVEQADYMFAEQLISEKDVYGQMEALAGVHKNPSETICGVLERVMSDSHVFYKVSIAAGILLAKSVNEESGYFGFQRVVQYFINNFCIQNTTIVRSNDFSSFRVYFMQKNIASSMALCQLDSTKSVGDRVVRAKSVVSAFLLNLMRYNDNTGNSYDDSFYLADIITALGVALCSDANVDTEPFVWEIERLRKKDLLFPSHQNILTCAAIKAFTRLGIQGHITLSYNRILAYAVKENFYKVRMAAFESIILLHPTEIGTVLDMAVIEDRVVRVKILRAIRDGVRCAALPIFETVGKYSGKIEEIGKIFEGDEEIEHIIREISSLLHGPTEIAADLAEDSVMHEMSSDEEAKNMPRIVVKLFKPLIIKISLKDIDKSERGNIKTFENGRSEKNIHKPTAQQKRSSIEEEASTEEYSKEEEREEEEIDINALYEKDTHMKQYYLDQPQKVGAYFFILAVKKSKSSAHILQTSKRLIEAMEEARTVYKMPTFEDITVEASLIEKSKETEQAPEQAPEEDTKNTDNKNAQNEPPVDYSTIRIKIENQTENENTKNSTVCLFNACNDPIMPDIYEKGIEIFREYFKSAQYNTSSYSTIKYAQAHFEREYAGFFQIKDRTFHRIDSPVSSNKEGRAVMIDVVSRIIEEDRHKVFSVPIEVDVLKEYKYLEMVKRPLDLIMIKKALESGSYYMVECAVFDIMQVFSNCMVYNVPDSEIFKEAIFVKEKAEKILSEATPLFTEECTFSDALRSILAEVMTDDFALFLNRVSPAEYPQYYKIVKDPMALCLIQDRVDTNYYRNIVHFESEFQKIVSASLLYNGSGSEITKLSKVLVQRVHAAVQNAFPWHKGIFNKRNPILAKSKAGTPTNKKTKNRSSFTV